jgi:hypothetical protein
MRCRDCGSELNSGGACTNWRCGSFTRSYQTLPFTPIFSKQIYAGDVDFDAVGKAIEDSIPKGSKPMCNIHVDGDSCAVFLHGYYL